MTEINPTYANMMRTAALTPVKVKTKKQEVKEIIENREDPLAKYPLRAFGYSNEIGAAVSTMPVWGPAAESLLWVPALMYLGADIYDKYKKGKEGNYSNASVSAAVQQATFQGLASVLLPTAAVKLGQNFAGGMLKHGKEKLSATAQEEMLRKILSDFDKGKFAKANHLNAEGGLVKGYDKIMEKVLDDSFYDQMAKTRHDLKTESRGSKIIRFFGHSQRPIASAKSEAGVVENFLKQRAKDVYEIQAALESGDSAQMKTLKNKSVIKKFKSVISRIDKRVKDVLKEDAGHVIKKILNSENKELSGIAEQIKEKYKSHLELKALVSSNSYSSKMLEELMQNPENKSLIFDFTKRIEASRKVIRSYIKGKEMNLGLLKTAAGFLTLALFAVPIDRFVHKYVIQKIVEPCLDAIKGEKRKKTQ